MENFDNLIKRKSIKGSIVKAYRASDGFDLSFANGNSITDDFNNQDGTIFGNSYLTANTDFYFDIEFPFLVKKVIKLELIQPDLSARENDPSNTSKIQYLKTPSNVTTDTPTTDLDDSGPYINDFIDIVDINGNENIPFPYIDEGSTIHLKTTLTSPINTKRIRYKFVNRTEAEYFYVSAFKIFTIDGVYSFEFNDSVLETKAWNSSRYDGRQLQASTINEFTNGDTTYGKTPVLQNYTRNIYLGSRVVGMNSSSIDDGTLTHFEGFSYVTMHEYLTINDDLSITRHSIRGDDKKNTKKKRFYRSFYHDFPINSEVEIKLFDETIDDNLKSSYNIFNNSGQLQKMLLVERYDTDNTGSGYGVRYSGSNQLFYATSSIQNDLAAKFTIYNQQLIIDKFFTGSLISTPPAWAGGSNQDSGPANP